MCTIPVRSWKVMCALLGAGLAIAATVDAREIPAPHDEKGSVPAIAPGSAYRQANLVSDVAGIALLRDPELVDPWGIALTATSPFWVANTGSSAAGVYREDPGGDLMVINPARPAVAIPGGLPTGVVANATGDFVVASGSGSAPARFLFASITGNIVGWEPTVPAADSTTGVIAASHPGHVYTGLAIGNDGGNNRLYAADFANGTIDVYDSVFALTATVGNFADPTIPTTPGNTYHPHNIQNIGGALYIAYAKVGVDGLPENGTGDGFVRRFNPSGVRDLTFGINNGPLNAPWGMAIAPPSFGIFGGALLVGNFSDAGRIHAFNPTTGAFLGTLQDEGGNAIGIDQLWGLAFGNGATGGDVGALYFTAGIGREEHGLFGSLRPTTASARTLVRFSAAEYFVTEAPGSISVTVVRLGDTNGAASVRYAALFESQPGHAGPDDLVLAPGTLTFAPGQTSKTFTVAVTQDVFIENEEIVRLVLSNPVGAGLMVPGIATLTIVDETLFVDGFEND